MIDTQLAEVGIPLRYHLYLGASEKTISEIEKTHGEYIGIKIFLGQSTGDLLMNNDTAFEEVCRASARLGAIVAVHAEDEKIIQENRIKLTDAHHTTSNTDISIHSKIRNRRCAIVAMQKTIAMGKKYGTKLYILHASTKEEVELVRQAKRDGLTIALETTPHHLFLNTDMYESLGTKVQMNPPLRTLEDQAALWEGLVNGTIDTVGTDHAPHTLEEKSLAYGKAPSGVPGIETLLPLMLTAVRDGKLTLDRLIAVTRTNAEKFFGLPPNDDVVEVDMETVRRVEGVKLKTKCGWSPFEGWELVGWPTYTTLRGGKYVA